MLIPCSWFFLNWLSVAIFASGNGLSAFVSLAVFAGVTPPVTLTNAKTFWGFGYSASKRCGEMVTSPYAEPPCGGDNGHERDEREADHERGRGRRRALRVAHRVATRERSGCSADLHRRPTEHAGERRHERLREHRDPDEHRGRADAETEQPIGRRQPADEEGDEHQRERPGDRRQRRRDAEAGE